MHTGDSGRHYRRSPEGYSPSGRPGPKFAGCCRLTTSVGLTPALESHFGYTPLYSKGPRGRPRDARGSKSAATSASNTQAPIEVPRTPLLPLVA